MSSGGMKTTINNEGWITKDVQCTTPGVYSISMATVAALVRDAVQSSTNGRHLHNLSSSDMGNVVREIMQCLGEANERLIDDQISVMERLVDLTLNGNSVVVEGIELPGTGKQLNIARRLQMRLAEYYAAAQRTRDALELTDHLFEEAKHLDDTALILGVTTIQAQVQLAVGAVAKAKAAYVASQGSANKVYVKPAQQSQLDAIGGSLAAEEGDFSQASSYFTEAFENAASNRAVVDELHALESGEVHASDATESGTQQMSTALAVALGSLEMMLLCKTLSGTSQELSATLASKSVLPFVSFPGVMAAERLCRAADKADIQQFNQASKEWLKLSYEIPYAARMAPAYVTMRHRIEVLGVRMLRSHVASALQAFIRVPVTRLAKLTGLPQEQVLGVLSSMVLDGEVAASIEQDTGLIVLHDVDDEIEKQQTAVLNASLGVMRAIEDTTKALEQRVAMTKAAFRGDAVEY